MKLDTIIKNGTLVAADQSVAADIGIMGEQIAVIARDLSEDVDRETKVIDASERYVIPAGVDVHVHLALPFCGTVSSDDYDSGTRAAALGGITTVIDFAIPYAGESLHDAVSNWKGKAAGNACVDYSFHVAITDWVRHQHEMADIVSGGLPTFKQFMIYEKEGWQADDAAMFGALSRCRELGSMLLVHAESSRVLDMLIEQHHNPELMQKYGARLHHMTRPNFIEAEAVERAIHWASVTGGKLFIVHLSTAEGASLIRSAKSRGLDVHGETCIQYLVLDDSVFDRPDGHLFGCCPQIKSKADQAALWSALSDGTLNNISTDTCTFTRAQKAMWEGDFTKIPMGLPGLETMLPLTWSMGPQHFDSLNCIVDKCCTSPAKMMGLYPRKGSLAVGTDADVTIIDPNRVTRVDHGGMATNADWNPYQGMELSGFAEHTFCRGRHIVDQYRFVGENGYGRFLAREPVFLV